MNIQPTTITDALKWRYATQVFDMTKPVSTENITAILESARLAPSSLGIEPWKFIVVENTILREKLKAAGYGQPKITDAPYLVIIAYRTDLEANSSRERIERTVKAHNVEASTLDGLKQMIDMSVTGKSLEELGTWAKAQTYIPLGMMIQTAALLGIDSGPMEGFDAAAVDDILGLTKQHLHATSMIAFGYRGDDSAALRPKVRREFSDVIEFIK